MATSKLTFTVILSPEDSKILTDVLEVIVENSMLAFHAIKPQSELLYQQFIGIIPNIRFMLKPDEKGHVVVNLYSILQLKNVICSITAQLLIGKSEAMSELWLALEECYNSLNELFEALINPETPVQC
jgi:hypothetical protein